MTFVERFKPFRGKNEKYLHLSELGFPVKKRTPLSAFPDLTHIIISTKITHHFQTTRTENNARQ